MIVGYVGQGCGGRGSVGRVSESQGGQSIEGMPVSDRGAQTNGAKARRSLLAKTGCCGRANRVVLAPVAGVKSAEVLRAQPGLQNPDPPMTVAK